MKTLIRNSTHINDRSYDFLLATFGNKKVKFTYQAYNAAEHFTVELFDGFKWNNIFSIWDLGVVPDTSVYSRNSSIRKQHADDLFKKAESMCKLIID